MRKVIGVMAVAVAVLVAPSVQAGNGPVVLHQDISGSFSFPFCSFDVTQTVSGTATIKLWLNGDGLVIKEIDSTPAATITFSSATKSFSFPGALISRTDYGSGATLGSTAQVAISGVFNKIPGLGADAGQLGIANAEVVGFNGQIPLTDGGDVVKDVGHSLSFDTLAAGVCTALA